MAFESLGYKAVYAEEGRGICGPPSFSVLKARGGQGAAPYGDKEGLVCLCKQGFVQGFPIQGEHLLSAQREDIFFLGFRERVAQIAELWGMILIIWHPSWHQGEVSHWGDRQENFGVISFPCP